MVFGPLRSGSRGLPVTTTVFLATFDKCYNVSSGSFNDSGVGVADGYG